MSLLWGVNNMNKMVNNLTKDAKVMGVAYTNRLHKLFIKHPNSTDNPQGYWEHLWFSFSSSMKLIWYGILGIIHSVFPFVFAFSTSSAIIRSFKKLVESNRHTPELKKYEIGWVFEAPSKDTHQYLNVIGDSNE